MKNRSVYNAAALILSFLSSQAMAQMLIGDDRGCKVLNSNPQPNESITWSGNCRDGYTDGQGVLQWFKDGKAGSRYEGNMVKGRYDGKGNNTYANGNRYDGNWVAGTRSGNGTLTWANGDRYEGNWANGNQSGKGTYTWANGGRSEGSFVDGKFTDGIEYDPNGAVVAIYINGQKQPGGK